MPVLFFFHELNGDICVRLLCSLGRLADKCSQHCTHDPADRCAGHCRARQHGHVHLFLSVSGPDLMSSEAGLGGFRQKMQRSRSNRSGRWLQFAGNFISRSCRCGCRGCWPPQVFACYVLQNLRGWLITDLNGAAELNNPVAHIQEVE